MPMFFSISVACTCALGGSAICSGGIKHCDRDPRTQGAGADVSVGRRRGGEPRTL